VTARTDSLSGMLVGHPPAPRNPHTGSVGSCRKTWPEDAAHRHPRRILRLIQEAFTR